MILTLWILLIVFGLISLRVLLIEFFGAGLTYVGYLVLFPSVIITAICVGIMFGGLHIPILGV